MEILVFFIGIIVGVFAMSIAMISKRKKIAEFESIESSSKSLAASSF
jgi:hypothetical protein